MKSSRTRAGILALAIALAFAAVPVRAHRSTQANQETSPKPVWLKGEVMRVDDYSMTVRERDNPLELHTFTYAPRVQPIIWKIQGGAGYQYGDKVSILHQPGQTVALKIHGKPSKPR
ncbi:MAG: hypothetical protein LAN59_03195 [Acidobacteriia bacterium]|nr:hypothetical protein [Terriglobia bacterium]